jgi:hypothetical protein
VYFSIRSAIGSAGRTSESGLKGRRLQERRCPPLVPAPRGLESASLLATANRSHRGAGPGHDSSALAGTEPQWHRPAK